MKCHECSYDLPNEAHFCLKCGAEIQASEAGLKDSVAVDSPGAGSVYAPIIDLSTKGEERKYCPSCDNIINEKNIKLFCFKCKKVFCTTCESFFRSERNRGEHPYCSSCSETMKIMRKEHEELEQINEADITNREIDEKRKSVKELEEKYHYKMQLLEKREQKLNEIDDLTADREKLSNYGKKLLADMSFDRITPNEFGEKNDSRMNKMFQTSRKIERIAGEVDEIDKLLQELDYI